MKKIVENIATKRIAEYVKNQLYEEVSADQLTFKECLDTFTGEQANKSKNK